MPRLHGATADRIAAWLAILFLAAAMLVTTRAHAATGDPVLLNEVLASHTGSDTTEFVELYGTPGASLAGLSLVAVEGDTLGAGTIDVRIDFGATAHLGGNGFFLVGNPAGLLSHYGVVPDLAIANDTLENSSLTLALVRTSSVGGTTTLVTGNEVVLDALGLADAVSDTFYFGAPVFGPDDVFFPAGAHRVANGVDTDTVADWALADFNLGPTNTPTPATPYDAPPTADCGAPLSTVEGTAATRDVSAVDPDGVVVGFSLASTPDPGTISVGSVVPAATVGGTATATVTVGAATPAGSYLVTVTASTSASVPQTATCDLAVTVDPAPPPPPAPQPEATVDSLRAALDGFMTDGSVDARKGGILADRLDRIERFLAAGQTAAALAQLQAFGNQVAGFTPRWVEPSVAEQLTEAADALAQELSPG